MFVFIFPCSVNFHIYAVHLEHSTLVPRVSRALKVYLSQAQIRVTHYLVFIILYGLYCITNLYQTLDKKIHIPELVKLYLG